MRCTSRCFRASSLSRSKRSFSATRARSSVSNCSLNANSNCIEIIGKCHYSTSNFLKIFHTKVILFNVSNFSSCASMVFSKSSCFLMSSSTCHIESPNLSSFKTGSRVCIHDSRRSASRLNNLNRRQNAFY